MKSVKDLPVRVRYRLFRALRDCVELWAKDCDFYKDADEETQSEFQPCLYIYKAQGVCHGVQICYDIDVMKDLNNFFAEFGSAIGMDETSEEDQKQILLWARESLGFKKDMFSSIWNNTKECDNEISSDEKGSESLC